MGKKRQKASAKQGKKKTPVQVAGENHHATTTGLGADGQSADNRSADSQDLATPGEGPVDAPTLDAAQEAGQAEALADSDTVTDADSAASAHTDVDAGPAADGSDTAQAAEGAVGVDDAAGVEGADPVEDVDSADNADGGDGSPDVVASGNGEVAADAADVDADAPDSSEASDGTDAGDSGDAAAEVDADAEEREPEKGEPEASDGADGTDAGASDSENTGLAHAAAGAEPYVRLPLLADTSAPQAAAGDPAGDSAQGADDWQAPESWAQVPDFANLTSKDQAKDPVDDLLGGLVGDGGPSRAPKVLGGILAALVVLAGVYVGAQWLLSDRVPPGVTVAGVDIGGLGRLDAIAALEEGLAERSVEPFELQAGEAVAVVDPASAGLSINAVQTVDSLTEFSLMPGRLWEHVFGGQPVDPILDVNTDLMEGTAQRVAQSLSSAPVDGMVMFAGGQAVASLAVEGQEVTAEDVMATVYSQWLIEASPLLVPASLSSPDITQEATLEAMDVARRITSAPVTAVVEDQTVQLSPALLADATTFIPDNGQLLPIFDGGLLADNILDRTVDLLREPQEAYFTFVDRQLVIAGGDAGTTLDAQVVAEKVGNAALYEGAGRATNVPLTEVESEYSRAALEELGVTEVVGRWAIGELGPAERVQNLARGAELITGYLLEPGQEFSLLGTLSPITAANGFAQAGVILHGRFQQGIGGGLSQLATVLYNAAFFAGADIVEFQPHTLFVPRYPAGREATLAIGSLDLRFINNSSYAMVLSSYIENGELVVEIWSTPYFRVEYGASARTNHTGPSIREIPAGPDCVPSGLGPDGFTITNWRQVFRLSDNEMVIDEAHTWTYAPTDGIRCVEDNMVHIQPPNETHGYEG